MGDFWSGETNYDRNEPKRRARDEARAKNETAKLQSQYDDYASGNSSGFSVSGSLEERQKALEGLQLAKTLYGQDVGQIGKDISGIREKLKARSEQSDPISEAIRGQKAGAMASAQRNLAASGVKGGAAAGAVSNIGRAQDADIAASLYGQQRQSIADERSLASNTLSGTVGLMQGGKAEGTQMPDLPQASSWTNSVICTELHRQGLLSSELYAMDSAYGQMLEREHKEVIVGYHIFGKPTAWVMKHSKIVTKVVAPFAIRWAKHIAGEKNIVGSILFNVGVPFCAIIGKIKLLGEKYVSFRCYQER